MILKILLCVLAYAVAGVLNYGIMLAYFQRARIEYSIKNYKLHREAALSFSYLGIFSLMGSLIIARFPKYGIKFWEGESEFIPLTKIQNKFYMNFCAYCDVANIAEGRCKEFWEK